MIPATPDVSGIPTPPGQALYLFYNFFFPSIAIVFFALRCYTRLKGRLWGLGAFPRLRLCAT